jgi:soluble lytic murein transglycosylase-like protein
LRNRVATLAASLVLVSAVPAGASVPHTVMPGETLWSIAAANNFTTRALAAANGLSENSNVVLGSTLRIPSVAEASAAMAQMGIIPGAPSAGGPAAVTASTPQPSGPLGGYTVRAGDTLAALAARSGVSVQQIAYMNGLDPARYLLIGTVLKLPTGASTAPLNPSAPAPATRVLPGAQPYTTPERVTSAQIGQIAAAHDVPASLASAIAWQESGFNNALTSSANARGVMQIMPGTWNYVEQLAGHPMNPNSALENVHAGVMYLQHLLYETGGNQDLAAAAYYEGLSAVRSRGLYEDTKRYVASVNALRSRFGG